MCVYDELLNGMRRRWFEKKDGCIMMIVNMNGQV